MVVLVASAFATFLFLMGGHVSPTQVALFVLIIADGACVAIVGYLLRRRNAQLLIRIWAQCGVALIGAVVCVAISR